MPDLLRYATDMLEAMRQEADPLADEAVARLVADKGAEEARRLFDMLIRRIALPVAELPPSFGGFLEATRQLPGDVDMAQAALAQSLFTDHGPKFLVFLFYKSLPLVYDCGHLARVLAHTGRLAHQGEDMAIFARRIAETGQFLLDVMAPGALLPGGRGIEAIQKVRLIHASIRHFISEGQWNQAEWGRPINQEDLAITLLSFSVCMLDGLEQFGVQEPAHRQQAYVHIWGGIGRLLGIRSELIPADVEQSRALLRVIQKRQAVASDAGQALTRALIAFSRQHLPARAGVLPEWLISHLVGEAAAQRLGITPAWGCMGLWLPTALRVWLGGGERIEDRLKEPLQIFIDLLGQQAMQAMLGVFDGYKGRNFHLPEGLEAAWRERGWLGG